MPRYLWAQQYVAPGVVSEYTITPESRYDQHGYAHNTLPEIRDPQSTVVYVNQDIPAPYGIPR